MDLIINGMTPHTRHNRESRKEPQQSIRGWRSSFPKHYREGNHLASTLVESLNQLLAQKKITNNLMQKILIHFDVRMTSGLSRTTPHLKFMAEGVSYKLLEDKIYYFEMKNFQMDMKSPFGGSRDRVIATIPKVRFTVFPTMTALRRLKSYSGQGLDDGADSDSTDDDARKKRSSKNSADDASADSADDDTVDPVGSKIPPKKSSKKTEGDNKKRTSTKAGGKVKPKKEASDEGDAKNRGRPRKVVENVPT